MMMYEMMIEQEAAIIVVVVVLNMVVGCAIVGCVGYVTSAPPTAKRDHPYYYRGTISLLLF
jgi:uncharacterized membrane protein